MARLGLGCLWEISRYWGGVINQFFINKNYPGNPMVIINASSSVKKLYCNALVDNVEVGELTINPKQAIYITTTGDDELKAVDSMKCHIYYAAEADDGTQEVSHFTNYNLSKDDVVFIMSASSNIDLGILIIKE